MNNYKRSNVSLQGAKPFVKNLIVLMSTLLIGNVTSAAVMDSIDVDKKHSCDHREVPEAGGVYSCDSESVSNLYWGRGNTATYELHSNRPTLLQAMLQFEGFESQATDPCGLDPDKAYRGMAFLSSNINNGISLDEITDFVSECYLDFLVIDFAWITYHWPQTDLAAVEQLAAELAHNGVEVAAMYRPRTFHAPDPSVHNAQNCDGTTDPDHLCFAYEDSVAWGAQWGTGILNALPSVNKVIIYNLLAPCCCPLCQGGQGAIYAEQFMERCRLEWDDVRPGVQIGHVGLGAEYAAQVDFFCPFLIINRWGDPNPVDVNSLLDDLITPDSQPGHKAVVPLAKICWGDEATDNTTEDIVSTIEACENRQRGFILWYYDWIFYTGRYDGQAIAEALGGQSGPDLTFPYPEAHIEPLPWPHQAPWLTPEQIELLNQQVWVINDFPLYQADEEGVLRYFHGGLDIVLDNGTPIYALKDGWVKAKSTESPGYYTITIADAAGTEPSYGWEYTHLGNFQVDVGDFVTKGTFIGQVDFPDLAHIHLSKVFSEGPYWGSWRYMCMPNGHFSYIDAEPPVIKIPFYFFKNNSDTMIQPDGTGNVIVSGQVDIVVPMREQGLYARSNESGFGDRLGITKIEYEIRPQGSPPGSGYVFQSFDFNDIKVKSSTFDPQYNAELTKVVYKHWTLFEPERPSGDKTFSYYIVTNCSGEQSPQELDTADRNYCWDTAALDQNDSPLFPDGTYDITVTAHDFDGHSSSQAVSVILDNQADVLRVPDQFPTIQEAVNAAVDGDTISVAPGVYQEEIDFVGKAITVQGAPAGATIDGGGTFGVLFLYGEGPGSILKNFVIRNSYTAIFLADTSPTLRNLTVCDNECGVVASDGAQPDISNSIFWNNNLLDLWFCGARYSCIEDGEEGLGNITDDPLFVDPINGDYHLKSQAGRWNPDTQSWVGDDVTSPCIDAGNAGTPPGEESSDPNNLRINMGAYGGTAQASKSPANWRLLADLNNDDIVNTEDYAAQARDWMQSQNEQPGDLNRDGTINNSDLGLLVADWLKLADRR